MLLSFLLALLRPWYTFECFTLMKSIANNNDISVRSFPIFSPFQYCITVAIQN